MGAVHTDRAFEDELRQLREQLLAMAGQVEQLIANATRAFVERDPELAEETILLDRAVNQAEVDIDEHCLVMLAKRQPMGSDLRFITHSLKMVTDLERIGDLAVNICERTVQLDELPGGKVLRSEIPQMAERVQSMVHDAIDAFIEGDAAAARAVVEADDEVDELYHSIFRAVLARMLDDPSVLERGIHIQSVAKFLERMGDHATNLGEHVVFMVKGKDIRHEGKLDPDD